MCVHAHFCMCMCVGGCVCKERVGDFAKPRMAKKNSESPKTIKNIKIESLYSLRFISCNLKAHACIPKCFPFI